MAASADMSEGIKFEWLDGPDNEYGTRCATEAEWSEIDDICVKRGWMSLNRRMTRILTAQRDDKIVGFHVMQMVPHAEPIYLAKEERGKGIAEELADHMLEFMATINARGWFVVADSPEAKKLCKERGMVEVKSPVYRTA